MVDNLAGIKDRENYEAKFGLTEVVFHFVTRFICFVIAFML